MPGPIKETPPVPVAIVVDEAQALRIAERQKTKERAYGYTVIAAAVLPGLAAVARLLYEWAEFGWQLFGIGA